MRGILQILTCFALSLPAAAECKLLDHSNSYFRVCAYDTAKDDIKIYNLDDAGKPYGTYLALYDKLQRDGKDMVFAMNAGMFGTDLKPIGLYVEGGRQFRKLNRASGAGNFHLKPNGVFYIAGSQAGVMDTDSYARSGIKPDYASQSGPMLVVKGAVHPKLSPEGTSAKLRNGVCVTDGHMVHFAISEEPVTFYSFASLFLERLDCENALFFDGSVSSIFSAEYDRNTQVVPVGPIVAVTVPKN